MVQPIAEILFEIKKSVYTEEPKATVILYGSYARGNNNIDSDIDILVLLDKEKLTIDDQKRIKYPLYEIEFEKGILISPFIISRKEWETKYRITPFYDNIAREGILL